MAFSSPCSGNYVKLLVNEGIIDNGYTVFVPLFGELCKTIAHNMGIAVQTLYRVFVPLFGELCKTSSMGVGQ